MEASVVEAKPGTDGEVDAVADGVADDPDRAAANTPPAAPSAATATITARGPCRFHHGRFRMCLPRMANTLAERAGGLADRRGCKRNWPPRRGGLAKDWPPRVLSEADGAAPHLRWEGNRPRLSSRRPRAVGHRCGWNHAGDTAFRLGRPLQRLSRVSDAPRAPIAHRLSLRPDRRRARQVEPEIAPLTSSGGS
jgi:hypothetical protein